MADVTVGIVLKAATDVAEKGIRAFAGAAAKAFKIVVGAAAAVGAAFVAMIAHTIKLADALANASDRTGASAEFLSALGFAAQQSGSSLAAVERGLLTISKNAVTGSKAFEKWGVSIKNSDGTLKTTEQLMLAGADRISKLQSSTVQAAAAQDLFGKAGKELLPILRNGAAGIEELRRAADEAGITIDSLTVRLGDELGDTFGKIQAQGSGITAQISQFFLPVLIVLARRFSDVVASVHRWIGANKQLIESKLTAFLIWIADNALPAIAVGVDLIAKVWLGWKLLFETLQFAAATFVEGVLSGFAAVSDWAGKLAGKLGAEGLAGSLEEFAANQRTVAAGFARDAEIASEAMAATAAEIKNTESAIGGFGTSASAALRQAIIDAKVLKEEMAAAGATGSQTPGSVAELPQAAAKKKPFKARGGELKKEIETVKELNAEYKQLAETVGGTLGGALAIVAVDSENAGDQIRDLTKTFIKWIFQFVAGKAVEAAVARTTAATKVTASAAEGAAAAGASVAGIPFLGTILAAGAIAAVFALIVGLLGKFHSGGIVPGPIGQERLALVQGGEEVISSSERRARESRNEGRGGGGDTTIIIENFESKSLNVPSQAGWERSLDDGLVRAVDRMTARGAGFGRRNRRPLEGRG